MARSKLHKLIIPNVPDRGGRTGELVIEIKRNIY
jgi:hypothetical protein